jgi:hypothetical protein
MFNNIGGHADCFCTHRVSRDFYRGSGGRAKDTRSAGEGASDWEVVAHMKNTAR